MQKFEEHQVVRIIKSHNANGVSLTKGMIGTVYAGETYGTLTDREIPVWFIWHKDKFVGVDQDMLEVYDGDLDVLSAKANAYAIVSHALALQQQHHFTRLEHEAVAAVLRVRQQFHVNALCSMMGWQESEAIEDFQKSEETLRSIAAVPYRIAKKQP